MDILAVRTFLAVVETGSFVAAGRAINASQSTVSARIKGLENLLGKPVFVRSKGGCDMTPAGIQFLRYAQTLVRTWEEARHQVAVPEGFDETIHVGAQYSLWPGLMTRWLKQFRADAPRVSVRCEVGMPPRLMRELGEGALDLAVIYRPEHRRGLVIEKLLDDRLILVAADPSAPVEESYVYIDWGEAFRRDHAIVFPSLHNPGLTLDLGAIGVDVLIDQKAAGYFPERIARPFLEERRLHKIVNAPAFDYPVYVVYRDGFAADVTRAKTLETLRRVARAAR